MIYSAEQKHNIMQIRHCASNSYYDSRRRDKQNIVMQNYLFYCTTIILYNGDCKY